MSIQVLHGDCREVLRDLRDRSVQLVCTSPPYYNQRDYKIAGQIGLELSPSAYVEEMVTVFRAVRRVLRDDGLVFLNLGDSFSAAGGTHGGRTDNQPGVGAKLAHLDGCGDQTARRAPDGIPAKNLLGIPWRVAFAMQDDGWILRSDNVWGKPNGMPESVDDRPTRSHEYVFMFAKSNTPQFWTHEDGNRTETRPDPDYVWLNRDTKERVTHCPSGWPEIGKKEWRRINLWSAHDYYYDHEAVRTAPKASTQTQLAKPYLGEVGKEYGDGSGQNGRDVKSRIVAAARDKQRGHSRRHDGFNDRWDAMEREQQMAEGGNLRSVWWISPAQFPDQYDFLHADYVDGHGIPRKVSPDCPVHGQPQESLKSSRAISEYDEQPDPAETGSGHTESDPAQVSQGGSEPTARHTKNSPSDSPDALKGQSIPASRIGDEPMVPHQMSNHSTHTQELHGTTTDYSPDMYSETAISHNTQSRRKFLSPSEPTHDTLSARPTFDTSNMTPKDGYPAPVQSSPGSNILGLLFSEPERESDRPQKVNRSGRKQKNISSRNNTCICQISKASHFAVMPDALAEICIRAGSRPGDLVLDPFAGVGTTLIVADRLQRNAAGIELNDAYVDMLRERVTLDCPLFAVVT